jgi:hypothetical protein
MNEPHPRRERGRPEPPPAVGPPGETYRLLRPASDTWRPHAEGDAPPGGDFVEARTLNGPTDVRPIDAKPRARRKQYDNPIAQALLGHLPMETETTVFILINLLDFFCTYWLLMAGRVGNLRFVESNPVARYFIESWGPVKGMLGFKLTVVTFVCLVAQIIAIKREDLGRKVLLFGTVATGAVVVYSVALYLRHT